MAAPNMQNASFSGATNITVMRSFTIIGSDVVAEDAVNDLALLPMGKPLRGRGVHAYPDRGDIHHRTPRACRADTERPSDGKSVAVSGYPLRSDSLVTNAGCIASGWLDDRDAAALLRSQNPTSYESVDRSPSPLHRKPRATGDSRARYRLTVKP